MILPYSFHIPLQRAQSCINTKFYGQRDKRLADKDALGEYEASFAQTPDEEGWQWAARITVEVQKVKMERAQAVSELKGHPNMTARNRATRNRDTADDKLAILKRIVEQIQEETYLEVDVDFIVA